MAFTRLLAVELITIISIEESISATSKCNLRGDEDLPGYDPVIVTAGHLAQPEVINGNLVINLGENFVLACPGKKNKFQRLLGSINSAEVSCSNNGSIQFNKKYYNMNQFTCTKAASGKALVTSTPCADGQGIIVELGFEINDDWYPNIKICHNMEKSSSLYAEHVLYGTGLQENVKSTGRPGFQEGGLYPDISISNVYEGKTFQNTLELILGSRNKAQQYVSKTYMAKGHLAPRADFLMQVYQNLSHFYVNTVPEWQKVNVGNWVKLENMVRKYAEQNQENLNVISGVYDVLTLPSDDDTEKPIYLYNDGNTKKVPVPKYLWKVIYDSNKRKGIAYIVVNNPFLKKISSSHILCPDICESYGWYSKSWHEVSKGYLYCCEISELRNSVDIVPNIRVKSTLNF